VAGAAAVTRTRRLLVAAIVAGLLTPTAHAQRIKFAGENGVRIWPLHYKAHDGWTRKAYLVLPNWYGPHDDPPIPLIISPHGRGVPAIDNVHVWGNLPWYGRFGVINPEGQGRRLTLYAWGDPGDVRDLAAMPRIARQAYPWLRIDPHRVYAFGGSMGGQETLLLVARHPHLLAGAAAFDAPTNMAARYFAFSQLRFGASLQERARLEIGGTPLTDPRGYRVRSPLDWAKRIAYSGVPLQIWWSRKDKIVTNQARESGALYRDIVRLNPAAPVIEVVGNWRHTAEMHTWSKLPFALRLFGLLPPATAHAGGLRLHGTS
jgi:poly(3-hydroxybutyrate) depolymerase